MCRKYSRPVKDNNVDHGQETAALNYVGSMRIGTGISNLASLNLGRKDIRDGIRWRDEGGQSTRTVAFKL